MGINDKLRWIADREGLSIRYADLRASDGMIYGSVITLAERIRGTEKEPEILAHELAHYYLHHSNVVGDPDAEAEADALARILVTLIRSLDGKSTSQREAVLLGVALAISGMM